MKKLIGWIINLSLIGVGVFFIYQYFQPEVSTGSNSDAIVQSLQVQAFDDAFRAFQQVTLNDDDIIRIKDELLLQTLRAKDEMNEERLILLKAFVDNSPVSLGTSFHMPILNNINVYLDFIDLGYIQDCHIESHQQVTRLRALTTRFIDSILPYYRNGQAQALNNARVHYNNAITLDIEACYSPVNYLVVFESGLTFMSDTLENPNVNNYVALRDSYFEVLKQYDEEVKVLDESSLVIKSRLNTINLHQERYQEVIDKLNP
jgi:hypothetical protein